MIIWKIKVLRKFINETIGLSDYFDIILQLKNCYSYYLWYTDT